MSSSRFAATARAKVLRWLHKCGVHLSRCAHASESASGAHPWPAPVCKSQPGCQTTVTHTPIVSRFNAPAAPILAACYLANRAPCLVIVLSALAHTVQVESLAVNYRDSANLAVGPVFEFLRGWSCGFHVQCIPRSRYGSISQTISSISSAFRSAHHRRTRRNLASRRSFFTVSFLGCSGSFSAETIMVCRVSGSLCVGQKGKSRSPGASP